MTSCRIERKRAHDREAQRASRAKTKAYIQHLEKTVADLTQSSSGDDRSRSNYLAQHATKQSQEIESLQGLVNKIRSLVQDTGAKSDHASPPYHEQARLKHEGSTVDSKVDDSATVDLLGTRYDSPRSDDQWTELPRTLEQDAPKHSRPMSATRNLIVMGVNMLCEDSEDCSFFPRLNEAISKLEQTPDNLSLLEEDQDIMIRAIVSGWDAAESVHHFDIAWRFIRAFDEGLWYRAAPLERLAVLWRLRNNLVYKIQPKNQARRKISSYMYPTLAQRARAARPPVVDYFTWPQVRDGLLIEGIERCPGKSTIAFAENFRVDWPYELRDVYKYNKRKGVYCFSHQYLETMDDVAAFKMLNHTLVPYYTNPTLAPTFPVSEIDSDESVDEELQATREPSTIPSADALMQEASNPDWTVAFPVDLSELAGNYAYDPFPRADVAGLAQWPTF
ncbi:Hypothetical predicted protein [Lecanosticta acicola]|uniref:BZIP domain-containing protein n=1 Tax=Lecanosticta acicola TaxID=111012 RepID=A0AAI8YRQ1_9PEZI|nr:Hypothetical predicted protein [Lecanosticta acicola]